MIIIKPSPTADTRSSDETTVSKKTLYDSSVQHIEDVKKAMNFFIGKLGKAAEKHDYTKIDTEGINSFHENFAKGLQGDEFKAGPWYQRHINEERHHLTDRIPEDISLIDVLERICDMVMAGMGRTGNVTVEPLDLEILHKAYLNTIELLKSNVRVEK